MNAIEVGDLLGRLQLTDNRRVDDSVIERWTEVLDDVDAADAEEARVWLVKHTESYITASGIRARIRWAGRDRAEREKAHQRALRPLPVGKPVWFDAAVAAAAAAARTGADVDAAVQAVAGPDGAA